MGQKVPAVDTSISYLKRFPISDFEMSTSSGVDVA
jgi:hypothetical protein